MTTSTRETTTRAWIYDVRMAQFVLKIEKLSHIMGPRASQDLRSPSPIMAPGIEQCSGLYYDKHLILVPRGTVNFVSRESQCFPRRSRGKHQGSRENKTNSFPRDHTLSVYCFSRNSLGSQKSVCLQKRARLETL